MYDGLTLKKFSTSPSALNAVAANLLDVIVGAYLICRHRHTVSLYAIVLIFFPLGIQLVGQVQRARAVVKSMEALPFKSTEAVFDLLFWAAIANLMLLVFIGALLKHIDGFV